MKSLAEQLLEMHEKGIKFGEAKELADVIIFFKGGEAITTEDVTGTDLKAAVKIADDFMKKSKGKFDGYTIHDKDEKIIGKSGSKG